MYLICPSPLWLVRDTLAFIENNKNQGLIAKKLWSFKNALSLVYIKFIAYLLLAIARKSQNTEYSPLHSTFSNIFHRSKERSWVSMVTQVWQLRVYGHRWDNSQIQWGEEKWSFSLSLSFSQQCTSEAKEILKGQDLNTIKFSLAYRFTTLGENSISFYLIFILFSTTKWMEIFYF